MDELQKESHIFESDSGGGLLVYVIDNAEPVCLKFSSIIKVKVFFGSRSEPTDADVKSDLAEGVSVQSQIADPLVADVCDCSAGDGHEHSSADHDDVGAAGDVSDESRLENADGNSDSEKWKSRRRRAKKSKTVRELAESVLYKRPNRRKASQSPRHEPCSKVKEVIKQGSGEKVDVPDWDCKNGNHIDDFKSGHLDKVYSKKLRSSKRVVQLNVKLPAAVKATKIGKTLLKSKMRRKAMNSQKFPAEHVGSPKMESEDGEELQVKERPRKLLIEKTVNCEYCLVDFKNQQAFYDHRRVEESVHTCGICGKVEPYEAHLIVHMQKHRRAKPGAAPGSIDKSKELPADSGHCSDMKRSKKEKMKCNICGLVVSSMDSLKIHTFLHTGEYAYRCCVCGEHFSSLSSRQHHMDIHVSAQRFKCNPCGERFTSRAELAKHQLTHEIKCALCGEIFPNKTSRTCHFRVSHPNDILKCSLCSNLFATMEDLDKHLAYHKKGKKEQCPVCGVVVSKLKDHMLMHSQVAQEKLYACDQCPMRYLRKSNLDRHMRTHTGEKPYACNRCPKSFRSNGMLRKHLLTHTKERPYQCEVCGKQCSLRSNLNIHMRVHNSDRHFSCAICSQSFNHKNSLHGHMKNKHAQEINMQEIKLNMAANHSLQPSLISAPSLVSEFDKHMAFSDKNYQTLDMPVVISSNTDSDSLKLDKLEKHHDYRQMHSHLDFPANLSDNMAPSLYLDNDRITLNKYDLHQQSSHTHGY